MADILSANEMFYTPFEPKLQNRFVLQIDGIPSYLVKGVARPSFNFEEVVTNHMNIKRYVKGKIEWQPISVTLYEAIEPSAAASVMDWIKLHHESSTGRDGYSDFYKKDISLLLIGPPGDKVEEWTFKGAWIQDCNFGDLSLDSSDPVEIEMSLRYDYANLTY